MDSWLSFWLHVRVAFSSSFSTRLEVWVIPAPIRQSRTETLLKQGSYFLPAAEQLSWLYWFLTCSKEAQGHTPSCPHTHFCPNSQCACPYRALYRSMAHASPKPIASISETAKSLLKTKLPPATNFKALCSVCLLETHRMFQDGSDSCSIRQSISIRDNSLFIHTRMFDFNFWPFLSRINQKMFCLTK